MKIVQGWAKKFLLRHMFRQGWWAVHWLPRSVGRKRAAKFKHARIFSHNPVKYCYHLHPLFSEIVPTIFATCILNWRSSNQVFQLTVNGDPGVNLDPAHNHVKGERRLEPERWLNQQRKAVLAKEIQKWEKTATPRNVWVMRVCMYGTDTSKLRPSAKQFKNALCSF